MKNSKYSRILSRLSNGTPLEAESSNKLWCQLAPQTKKNINLTISKSISDGATGLKKIYWLTAPFGGGKTQAVFQLTDNLANITGDYKFLTSEIDLKEYNSKFTNLSFDTYIINNIFKVNQPIEEIQNYVSSVSDNKLKQDSFHNNIASIGVDIFCILTQLPLAGLSLLLNAIFSSFRRKWRTSASYIKQHVKKFNIEDEESIDFLSKWLRHSMLPNEKTLKEFKNKIVELSNENRLLEVFFRIVKAFNYSGIMLILDESDRLRNGTLTEFLETFWDKCDDNEFDLIITFAGKINVEEFKADKYGGFHRRMADSTSASIKVEELFQPSTQNFEEHVDKALDFLRNISLSATGINFEIPDDFDSEIIVKRLSNQTDVTWNIFWNIIFTVLEENRITVPNTV